MLVIKIRIRHFAAALVIAALPTPPAIAQPVPAASIPSVARVEATLRAAEAVRAVKRLQHAWIFYLNEGSWNDAAALLAANATAQYGSDSVSGRDGVRRYLMKQAGRTQTGLAQGQLNTHLIMQPIITLTADGHHAKGAWHEMQMLGRFGATADWAGGIYENEYALDAGVWKISRIRFYPQYSGAYDDYGHKAPAKWNIPYHFEARHVGVSVPESAITALQAGSTATVASLVRRADALRDETEVANLQHAFGYYLDRRLWDDVADLFAAGGTLEFARRGVYVGRARIRCPGASCSITSCWARSSPSTPTVATPRRVPPRSRR
jgi:SnoaL-like domain